MLTLLVILILVLLGAVIFLNQPQFGRIASGERLELLKRSPNYRNGQFQNLTNTPLMSEGSNFFKAFKEFLLSNNKRLIPDSSIASEKTDLFALDNSKNAIIWFGHSSYFIQLNGKRFLVDPVLSGNAAPVRFAMRSFKGSDIYSAEDIPEIDYLLITHDHWDHLDYKTMRKIESKTGKVITGLGVGDHLERWGYSKTKIIEKDWFDTIDLDSNLSIVLVPSRHFSGRTFRRNTSLWTSFVLKADDLKIFLGCDGGYGDHFAAIGKQFGPFHLAMLECGQYNHHWRYIHSMPEDIIKESEDLKADKVMILHWGKFKLSNHDWDEPFIKMKELSKTHQLSLVTPIIGEFCPID